MILFLLLIAAVPTLDLIINWYERTRTHKSRDRTTRSLLPSVGPAASLDTTVSQSTRFIILMIARECARALSEGARLQGGGGGVDGVVVVVYVTHVVILAEKLNACDDEMRKWCVKYFTNILKKYIANFPTKFLVKIIKICAFLIENKYLQAINIKCYFFRGSEPRHIVQI